MNAERLLAHYERIAEAPDAIARLRRFILDLAVRGKLVPQDPNDEPASELLKQIAKERLDQAGLPLGWRRAKIGSILDFQYGKGLKASERLDEGPVPVFGSNGIVGFTDKPLTDRPAIIVGRKGSAGALNLCHGPSWTTDVAYFVEAPSFLDLRFMLIALAALNLDKFGKGVKPGLSRSEAYDQIIALPPLAEQHRIAAKVDELMGLCDRLEAAREAREATRDRLAAASLARLNPPDPETFHEDTRFALDVLPALTTRPDQIKRLRQTILNLAVRGKLVPQDSNDEPASELLKRIAKENKKLMVVKGIRPQKPAPPAENFETDSEIPPTWSHVYLQDIAYQITDGTHLTPKYTETGKPFLSAQNVKPFRFIPDKHRLVSEADFDSYRANRRPERGDILLTRVGAGIGEAAVLDSDFEFAFYVSLCLIKIPVRRQII
jgi:type I restriction enzyme S subunit